MENRPGSREENVKTGKSASIKRRGDGLDKGPVGNRTEEFIKEHYQKEAEQKAKEAAQPRPAATPKPAAASKPQSAGAPRPQAPPKAAPGNTGAGRPAGANAPQDKGIVGDLLGGMIENAVNNSQNTGSTGTTGSGLFGSGQTSGGNIFGAGTPSSGQTTGSSGGGLNLGGSGGSSGGSGGSSGGGLFGGGNKKGCLTIIIVIIVIVILLFLFRSCLCSGAKQQATSSSSSNSFATTPTTTQQVTTATASNSASSNQDSYGLSALLGGYDYDSYYDNYNYSTYNGNSYDYSEYDASSFGSSGFDISSLLGGLTGAGSGSYESLFGNSYGSSYGSHLSGVSSAKWDANTGVLNTAVINGSPQKYTQLAGNGKDTVTLMVYICGSDLESSGGAATMDIQEMLNASASSNVNIVLYTGGTRQWQNNVMSSSYNQIYQIKDGNLYRVESNAGNKPMTDPATLTEFIKYCAAKYPANRNMLVLWDHGGGSVSGYAYDENYKSNGYLSLAGINKALKNANMKFDIIGFDTCLMATIENALMLSNYADYLVASEEVEPGAGWYYTDWLSALAKNPSISSLELGKAIIDSFITKSSQSAYGVGCTLSLIDLAELSYTVPDRLSAFADDISAMIDSNDASANYKTVISARTSTREFGETQRLDQIDLVNFANNIGTDNAKELAAALKSAIKYNLVSNSMSYSYGVSIFFPYRCANYVSRAVNIYNEIGFSDSYTTCIRKAANISGNGQSIYGGSSSSGYGSLFDALSGGNSYSSSSYSSGDISGLFSDLFFGRSMTADDPECQFLAENHFDASQLVWTQNADGCQVITLPEDQWSLVDNITLNAFYDDGEGYIDLGADNYFELNEQGDLVGSYNGTWLSIDENIVAYYFDSMTYDNEDYTIQGHVPVLYNGESANLIIIFDSSCPKGYIAGVETEAYEDETAMVSKVRTNLKEGDVIDFVADYYTYDGQYENSYFIGDQWTYFDGAEIASIMVEGDILALYNFGDIYNNHYWTPVIPAAQ